MSLSLWVVNSLASRTNLINSILPHLVYPIESETNTTSSGHINREGSPPIHSAKNLSGDTPEPDGPESLPSQQK